MELSVVIVSYNVRELLRECIRSLYAQLGNISFEIIVVDNFSGDGSAAMVEKEFPSAIIIRNRSNAGFSEANNQGIAVAKGEYILLLNPDTFLYDDSLCRMLSFAKEQNHTVLIAPKLLNADRSLQHSAWHDKTLAVLLQETFRVFTSAYPLEKYTMPQEVENIAGAAMLFSKKLVALAGHFDSDMFWMEDFDFCYRVRKCGGKILFFPGAAIVHYGGRSASQNLRIMFANDTISKLKFYRKHKSFLQTVIAGLLLLLHLFAYTFFLLLLSPFSKKYRDKFLPYCYATGKFLRYIVTGKVALT